MPDRGGDQQKLPENHLQLRIGGTPRHPRIDLRGRQTFKVKLSRLHTGQATIQSRESTINSRTQTVCMTTTFLPQMKFCSSSSSLKRPNLKFKKGVMIL